MTLRIGFDMDGVLADFGAAFRDVELRLFGSPATLRAGDPEVGPPETEEEPTLAERRRRRAAVWESIQATPDFWTTLKPIDEGAVRRIHELMLRHAWEVVFLTQRPATAGETVQRQTQRWLVEQGFDLPSVLVIAAGRGAAINALRLDYHVDDSAQHCLDVIADSGARPVMISSAESEPAAAGVRQLGIAVVPSIGACLHVLEQATAAQANPGLLRKLAAMVGWR